MDEFSQQNTWCLVISTFVTSLHAKPQTPFMPLPHSSLSTTKPLGFVRHTTAHIVRYTIHGYHSASTKRPRIKTFMKATLFVSVTWAQRGEGAVHHLTPQPFLPTNLQSQHVTLRTDPQSVSLQSVTTKTCSK